MLGPRGQIGFKAKFFTSASTSWPQPRGFRLCLASVLLTWPQKCAIQCKIILVVFVCDLKIATFFTKTWLNTIMGHTNSVVLLALLLCVLIQKYLPVAGLGLEDLVSTSALWFWPQPWPQSFGLGLGLI